MPRLLLLRHAHAEAADADISDFFRPLSRKGLGDAEKIADYIAQNGLYPQKILCSSARRTRETLSAILPLLPEDCDIRMTKQLYEISGQGIMNAIHSFGETAELLLIVGHNPALSEIARVLAMRGNEQSLQRMQVGLPSGGLVVIDFEDPNWQTIIPGSGWVAGFYAA